MPDDSLSSILLLNTLSMSDEDCSVNLVSKVIFGKKPTVVKLSKRKTNVTFVTKAHECTCMLHFVTFPCNFALFVDIR